MIKNYSNRNYISSVKAWGAEIPSPNNNNNLGSILLGAVIGGAIAGACFYKINQKKINLLKINLAEVKSRNNLLQREMDMLAEGGNLTITETDKLMDDQNTGVDLKV
jgi:hypothetical protein